MYVLTKLQEIIPLTVSLTTDLQTRRKLSKENPFVSRFANFKRFKIRSFKSLKCSRFFWISL